MKNQGKIGQNAQSDPEKKESMSTFDTETNWHNLTNLSGDGSDAGLETVENVIQKKKEEEKEKGSEMDSWSAN